jgi:hypothetical protein
VCLGQRTVPTPSVTRPPKTRAPPYWAADSAVSHTGYSGIIGVALHSALVPAVSQIPLRMRCGRGQDPSMPADTGSRYICGLPNNCRECKRALADG